MIGGVTRHMLPHLTGVPLPLHVNRPFERVDCRNVSVVVVERKTVEIWCWWFRENNKNFGTENQLTGILTIC